MAEHKSPRVFTIEGEIGAGKTELAQALAARLAQRGLRVGLVLEPVAQWKDIGILQAFYTDPARHAYAFQTYVFATRVLAIHAALAAHADADALILERSPVTDPVFMELQRGDVSSLEMNMYRVWCDAWRALQPLDYSRVTAIYLRTSPAVCMERVVSRAREGETSAAPPDENMGTAKPLAEGSAPPGAAPAASASAASASGGVSAAYQTRLRLAHEAFFLGKHPGMFPDLPPNPIKNVIEVPPRLADADFRAGSPTSEKIVDSVLRLMGY